MPAKKDWVGMTFGRWTVKAEVESPRRVLCFCSCGEEREVAKCSLAAGTSVSCGCFKNERMAEIHGLSLDEKLWARTKRRKSGCLEWTGPVNSNGYGGVTHGGVTLGVHAAAWVDTYGPVPDGLHVLHTCDNRICCEPSHLFLGDRSANMTDMVQKGRAGRKSGWDTQSEEWKVQKREHIRAVGKKPKSDEHRAKISASMMGNKNRKRSPA